MTAARKKITATGLRDYQERGVARIRQAFAQGARSVLAVSPTGSGKTTMFVHVASEAVRAGERVLVLVHRHELADQAEERFEEFDVSFGLIMAGERNKAPDAPVQIASVQTLVNRDLPPADMVICDEAHLSTAETWQSILGAYPKARILGVTATPWRLSGKPLGEAYDASVIVATPSELREQGWLCGYTGFSYKHPDLSGVKKSKGDYVRSESAKAMGSSLIVDNIVEEWLKSARDLSTIVFAVTREHSKSLTERFLSAGVSARHLDGETPEIERKEILASVKSGETQVLCNVDVATEGFDIERLKCCVLARPTTSLTKAIQMVGRVRRPWNGQVARIHDHAFVLKTHGLPDDERDYALTAGDWRPGAVSICSVCRAMFRGAACPECSSRAPPESVGRVLKVVRNAERWEFGTTKRERAMGEREWSNERFVKVYSRDTVNWVTMPWEGRAVLPLLLRKCDHEGMVLTGARGISGLAALIGLPAEVTEVGIAALVEQGSVEVSATHVCVPKYVVAQGARKKRGTREPSGDALAAKVLELLDASPEPMTASAIAEAVGGRRQSALDLVRHLEFEGEIEKDGGRFRRARG